ncbi:MAG: DUF4852 domain-containing protein [Alcanivoracaceae bacterium]|nr:DUF4852 domain-containing protein [Alcanivoracaceae bacterium]
MKIVSMICLLLITVVVISAEEKIELTADNLTLLALKNSPAKKINNYALLLAKTENSTEYYSVRKDSEKLAALVERKNKKLATSLAQISNKSHFTLSQKIRYKSYDEKTGQLIIQKIIQGSTKAILRNKHKDDGLPDHFFLLFANIELLSDIEVDKNKFTKLLEKRNNENAQTSKSLYIEMTMVLPKYQNQKNFQTVIKNINIYASKAKKLLLASKQETQKTTDIITRSLVAEGITNKLIGIHAFSFFGYRLQDRMADVIKHQSFCKKTIKMDKHQIIVCKKPHSENSSLIITYIGGVIAQLDLIATGELNFEEKKRTSKYIMRQLNRTKSLFQSPNEKWSKYGVDFDFYSDAFFGKTSTESQYHFSYNKSNDPVETGNTLIISMISQATKKLIEENT